jgi:hypothetical protein
VCLDIIGHAPHTKTLCAAAAAALINNNPIKGNKNNKKEFLKKKNMFFYCATFFPSRWRNLKKKNCITDGTHERS